MRNFLNKHYSKTFEKNRGIRDYKYRYVSETFKGFLLQNWTDFAKPENFQMFHFAVVVSTVIEVI